jgi:hypothetical protein
MSIDGSPGCAKFRARLPRWCAPSSASLYSQHRRWLVWNPSRCGMRDACSRIGSTSTDRSVDPCTRMLTLCALTVNRWRSPRRANSSARPWPASCTGTTRLNSLVYVAPIRAGSVLHCGCGATRSFLCTGAGGRCLTKIRLCTGATSTDSTVGSALPTHVLAQIGVLGENRRQRWCGVGARIRSCCVNTKTEATQPSKMRKTEFCFANNI